MKAIIEDINKKLANILKELLKEKEELEQSLEKVNLKINEKVEEAREYKVEVDLSKEQIAELEEEINSLRADLRLLQDKFGSKNLTAVVEAGDKEINSKIEEKEDKISNHNNSIAELTEKARSIKDLLLNLKKDKATKEERLENLKNAHEYYARELNRLSDYARLNHSNLAIRKEAKNKKKLNTPKTEVFDEIASLDKDLKVVETKPIEEKKEVETNDFLESLRKTARELNKLEESVEEKLDTLPEVFEEDLPTLETLDKLNLNNPIIEEKLEEPIKEEKLEEPIKEEKLEEPMVESISNSFDDFNIPDIFGAEFISEEELNADIKEDGVKTVERVSIDEFFRSYALDVNRFERDIQDKLRNNYNYENFKKVFDLLDQNKIDLNSIYTSSNVLTDISYEEFSGIVNKLLDSNQKPSNIGYVLDVLPTIKLKHLEEAALALGTDLNGADITNLLSKAKQAENVRSV